MGIEKIIDEFLLLVSDPRNIASDEFAEYYPKPGEKGNPKNLDKKSIENHFINLQKFKISENWNGHISVKAKLYYLLELYKTLSKENKEIALNYYVLSCKNPILKTQSFVIDKMLSKTEYYNLLGAYTIFYSNLNKIVINEFKELSETEQKKIFDYFKAESYFNLFDEFANNHILSAYKDFSFLIAQMKADKFIHKKTHFEWIEWLKTEDYINEIDYKIFIDKGNLETLTKSFSEQRYNNYSIIKSRLLPFD